MADVRAIATEYGELDDELERRLDALVDALSPGWQPPELPEPYRSDERFRAYHRRNAKRMQVGSVLSAQPAAAARLADMVLEAIVCDEDVSFNRQLIEPMLTAIGRRRVQQHLIATVGNGGPLQKVCAVRAWYWSQVTLVYRSTEDLHEHNPTPESVAADDDVADLRALCRTACLNAFVTCHHVATREWLARGFILDENFYLPEMHANVVRARQIAQADPGRFGDLLAKTTDGTNMAAIQPQ